MQGHFKYEHEAKLSRRWQKFKHSSFDQRVVRHVYVTEETTNLFHVQFLVSQLLTTVPISLSVRYNSKLSCNSDSVTDAQIEYPGAAIPKENNA